VPDSQPLDFQPPRIYVLDRVWENPQAARRAERLAQACPGAEVETFSYAALPDIVAEEGWGHVPKMGTLETVPPPVPVLGLFEFDRQTVAETAAGMQQSYHGDGSFPFPLAAGGNAFTFFCSNSPGFSCQTIGDIRPNPQHVCRPQWRLHQGRGCPHQCAYCALGGYLISHLNTEEYIDRLGDLLRQNPWQKTWLYDDVMDVLALEPWIDALGPLMRFFESTGDRYLILHTKSDRVQALLDAGAPRNTIVAWSLSGPTQSTQLERGAGTTESRIEAARQCQQAGITVRYKFKPIVPVSDWRREAGQAVDLALSRTEPDNLSLTSLMWMGAEDLKACIPPDLLDQEFLHAAEAAAEEMAGARVGPLPHHMREQIYRHYLSEIRCRDADVPVTLSTESLEMWRSLGDDLGFTPANYVCGCGAGATPRKRSLESNPWRDARAALTWDGEPALPASAWRRRPVFTARPPSPCCITESCTVT